MLTLPGAKEPRQELLAAHEEGRSEPSPWYDLWAQSLMALWAFGQLILTGIGIWYVRRTLVETEKAVGEAAKATEAAQDAVAVTRESGERQLRAYINMTTAQLEVRKVGAKLTGVIVVKNGGQTPARKVETLWGLLLHQNDGIIREPTYLAEDESRAISVLAIGGEHELHLHSLNPLTEVIDEGLSNETWRLRFFARILYEDVFGKKHQTDISLFYPGHGHQFHPSNHGNEAT